MEWLDALTLMDGSRISSGVGSHESCAASTCDTHGDGDDDCESDVTYSDEADNDESGGALI